MRAYLAATRRVAANTPPTRNRVVDFWRVVAITVVMIGHWLAAAIWLRPDGEVALLNALGWVPYAAWVTWLVQVMPVFFLAGGYANARGLRRVISGEQRRREWITMRTRRLWTPVTPLLVIWVGLILVLRLTLDPEIVSSAAMSATIPLWFLAVYLTLTAAAPLTHRWWRSWGLRSVGVLVAIALVIDVARFAFDVPGVGWVNFLFMWSAVHQLGYWWADRDAEGGVAPRIGWVVSAAALATLIAVTSLGWYPVPMVGVPGAEATNMAPPTVAQLLLGLVQAGLIWATAGPVGRFLQRVRVWHSVVSVSGVIMTIYVWHLSSMSITAAIGLNVFDGAVFTLEPGTTTWWLSRPLWIAALLAVTFGLVVLFARFEWGVSSAPAPATRRRVTVGVVLLAGSAGAVAVWGLTSKDGVIHWSIPAAAVIGAAVIGALPRRPRAPSAEPAAQART